MSDDWQSSLARWSSAGLVDAQTAASIRDWEKEHREQTTGNKFAVVAFGLGGLLLVAGVLLFVASNWQQVSPFGRFILLTLTVAGFHVAGAFAAGSKPPLGTTLHAVGTGALGGAIFLSGQTFHLAENWPEGFLLWAIGAAAGLYLFRDWPHVLLTAVLGPVWLWSQLAKIGRFEEGGEILRPAASFTVLLVLAYLFAATGAQQSTWRRSLSRLGAVALIPAAIGLGATAADFGSQSPGMDPVVFAISWAMAILIPAGLAYGLRRYDAIYMAPAVVWVLALGQFDPERDVQFLGLLALYAAGSVGIVFWGLRDRYPLSVNLGVIGFALSILVFYFATELFSKLGRSAGLIGAGLLFIGGGWLLERTRRTIIGKIDEAAI